MVERYPTDPQKADRLSYEEFRKRYGYETERERVRREQHEMDREIQRQQELRDQKTRKETRSALRELQRTGEAAALRLLSRFQVGLVVEFEVQAIKYLDSVGLLDWVPCRGGGR